MEEVFLVYKTDAQRSYKSRDIIGVATSPDEAISICKQQAFREAHKITHEQLYNLKTLKQTQGYDGEGEFQYESLAVNKLL